MNSATVGLRERKTAFIEIFRTEEEEAVWDNLGLDKVGKQCNCCL